MHSLTHLNAHTQIELYLRWLGADFYVGTLHKWMFTLQGCAFIYCKDVTRGVVPLLPHVLDADSCVGTGGGGGGGGVADLATVTPFAAAFAPDQQSCLGYTRIRTYARTRTHMP